MTSIILSILFISFIVTLNAADSNASIVEEYENAINEFITNTDSFEYPTDSRQFLNGQSENITSNCEYAGAFDVIIIGAGSAGTVLANRLSEVSDWRILLIEAGGNETIVSDIPAMAEYLRLSRFNWGYHSVPQNHSLFGFLNNSERMPCGKALGGSSTINYMMYVRGNRLDFDKWALEGNPGWSYHEVLKYFEKSEDVHIYSPDFGYHGRNGPLSVEQMNILNPLSIAYLKANEELGRNIIFDYNGRTQTGFSILQTNTKYGRRDSGAKAFLQPVLNRKNLKVLTDTLVTKILIENATAYGVQYIVDGTCFIVNATKEVVVSAGAINSPQLLMLSGIGPKEELNKHGIDTKKELEAVGENMWDHIFNYMQPFTTNYTWPNISSSQAIEEYLRGEGYLTCADFSQDVGFVNLHSEDKTVPDIEHVFRANMNANVSYEYYKKNLQITLETYEYAIKPIIGKSTWSNFNILLHPKSRGTVKLKSKSPFDFPLINPNYMSDANEDDVNTLAEGLKDVLKMSKTEAMQEYNSTMVKLDLPNCRQFEYQSDAFFKCLVRNLASTIGHYSGTCKMGPSSDKMAVVDARLKVYGVKNLRVADCSVIPVTTSGHTNAVAYMIGEKGADLIKEDHLDMYLNWK